MAAAKESARAGRLYFVNGPVDTFCVGGASILLFVLLFLFHEGERSPSVVTWAARLMWVVNWPHFAATSYRLYRTRENVSQYPLTAFLIPLVVSGLAALALASPAVLAPAFVHVFLLWSPFHFSGQTVGVTLLYARRAGLPIGVWERRALTGFVFGTFVLQTVRSEGVGRTGSFWGVSYPTLGIPEWAVTLATVALALFGIAFVALLATYSARERRTVPLIVLVPSLSQLTWFVLGPTRESYTEFVPFFHSLQYLLVAWAMQMKERAGNERVSGEFLARESAHWGVANVAIGSFLFWFLPQAVETLSGVPLPVALAVVLAAVQIHHFFVDGVIWKLRNERVESPLMTSLADLLARGAPPEARAEAT